MQRLVPRLALAFAALPCMTVRADVSAADPARKPPNIVLILVDDLGWRDLGCQGNDFVDTPHIDGLAAAGIRFTDAYASGAVCSPTRAALQAGQNQARIGVTDFIPGHWRPFERVVTPRPKDGLPLETVTVAETLKTAGYRTGYIGKWHLGPFGPAAQGYDFAVVVDGPHLPGRFRGRGPDAGEPDPGQYRTEYEADLAARFIGAGGDAPFFLMVSPYAVHIPLAGMSDKVAKYRARAAERGVELPHPVYAAMIEHVDDMVGRIDSALDAAGLRDDTLFVVTSDNGGLNRRYDYRAAADDIVATQAPLRGEKGTLFEGGIRVPLIVRYPAGIAAAGTTCAVPTVSHDLYPTFATLAGAEPPANQPLDGVDVSPLFADPNADLDRDAIHWHYPQYHHDRPATAIRAGRYKLIEYLDGTGERLLFDLAEDLGETRDLAEEMPERVADLQRRLQRWRTQVLAPMPHANPAHDPARAGEWWSVRTGAPVPSDRRRRFPQTEKG